MSNEYPCATCRRVPKPNNCENKSCKVWRDWFLQKWAELHKGKPQRLIDAHGVVISIAKNVSWMISCKGCKPQGIYDGVMRCIAEAPTVDAVEVVHGEWKRTPTSQTLYCGVCDKIPECQIETDYCPNCGAKMDGE